MQAFRCSGRQPPVGERLVHGLKARLTRDQQGIESRAAQRLRVRQEIPQDARHGGSPRPSGLSSQGKWKLKSQRSSAKGGGSPQGGRRGRAGACPGGPEQGNSHLLKVSQLHRASGRHRQQGPAVQCKHGPTRSFTRPKVIRCLEDYNTKNTIFVQMRKNAHFETTIPTIAGKNSRIVVGGKETIFDLATNKMAYKVPM